jgi:hypothetical protein
MNLVVIFILGSMKTIMLFILLSINFLRLFRLTRRLEKRKTAC